MVEFEEILLEIEDLKQERGVPRNVRAVLDDVLRELKKENENINIKINTAISMMDEVANDINLKPFARTRVWQIVSMMESFQESLD